MKYAIVEISGRQFWIEEGKYYDFNRLPKNPGEQIVFDKVLLINDNDALLIGEPYIKNISTPEVIKISVLGKVVEHRRGKKTIVYKMRPKKKTRKKQGHRQELTRVLIEKINSSNDN
jgi:large subunit ribosomal protein L21